MSEFIEFLSPNALAQLKEASEIVDDLASKIEQINKFKAPTTPGGVNSASKQIIDDLKAQEQAIKKVSDIQRQIETNAKNQTSANQKLTKSEYDYAKSVERAIKAKEKGVLADERAAKTAERSALANQRLNDAYGKLNRSRNEAARVLQNLIASETASNAEIRKAQREFDVLNDKVKKADKAVGNFSRNVGNYGSALSGVTNLMGAFGIATGVYLAVDLVKNFYETTKQLQSLDLALKMVSETQDRYASNTAFVAELSETWGIEIKGLTEQFTQFYVNAKGKLSDEAIKKSFEGIAKAGSLMGISIDKQNDAFYAFNQMLSKGTVQAEELKKQLGNALPGAIKAATMAYQELNPNLKVTEQMMLDQMKAGNLISNEMVPAIIRAYQKLYGIENINGVDTLAAAQNRLTNSWTAMVKAMNESGTDGIGKWFNYVLKGLNFLTNEAERFIKSWDSINKKAEETGTSRGIKSFKEDISKATSRKEEETIIKFTQESTKTSLSRAEGELKDVEDYLKRTALIQGDYTKIFKTRNAKFRKEELLEEIAFLKAKANVAKNFIKDRDVANAKKIVVGGADTKEGTDEKAIAKAKALAKEKAQADEKLLKDKYDLEVSNAKRLIEITKDDFDIVEALNKDELDYFENGAKRKYELSLKLAKLELALAQIVATEKKRIAKGNKDLGIAPTVGGDITAQNEYYTEAENIAESHVNRLDKINKDFFKSMGEDIPKDIFGDMYKMTDEQKEALKEHEEKVKNLAELQKKIVDEFKNYIQSFAQEFASSVGFSETFDFFLKVDEEGKTMFTKLNEMADGTSEKFAATFLAISESVQETFNFIAERSQKNYDEQYRRLEDEKNIALAFAGESATGRAEVERQYEEKRRKIANEQAKAQKKQALFNITINTIQATVAAYASQLVPGDPTSIVRAQIAAGIIASIGAINLAIAASTDVPSYKDGTDNHIGGAMIVNDQNGSKYKEIVETPDGKRKIYEGRNVRINAPKGTKVFTAEKSALMFNDNLNSILTNNGISGAKVEVNNSGVSDEQINRIVSSINNKESVQIYNDGTNIITKRKKANQLIEIANRRINFVSKSV